jgi:iron-sulfur cluster assembly protein CyaY
LSSLSEEQYDALAYPELGALVRALDTVEHPGVEAELASDILTIEFVDGTRYVVNSHRAARQIWMAAERNAWHFDWVPEKQRWIAAKSGDELWTTVSRIVGKRLGAPIALVRGADG